MPNGNDGWVITPIPGRENDNEDDFNEFELDDFAEIENSIENEEIEVENEVETDEITEEHDAEDQEVEESVDEDTDEESENEVIEDEVDEESEADSTAQEEDNDEVDETKEEEGKSSRSQRRIQKLARQKNEAEEFAKAQAQMVEDLQKQIQAEKAKRIEIEKKNVENLKESLDARIQSLSSDAVEAMNIGDNEKAIEAQKTLHKVQTQREILENKTFEEVEEAPKAPQPTHNHQPTAQQISDAGKAWLTKHEKALKSQVNQAVAVSVSNDLDKEGYDMNTSEYFEELDKRLGEELVAFKTKETPKPKTKKTLKKTKTTQTMSGSATSPVTRKNALPKLTAFQKSAARELGLTEKEYAESIRDYNPDTGEVKL